VGVTSSWFQLISAAPLNSLATKGVEMNSQQLQAKIKKLEAQVRAQEHRHQQLMETLQHLPTGIEVYDKDGVAEYLNTAMMNMIALPSADLVLGQFNILTDPFSEQTGMKVHYDRAYAGEVVHTEEFMVEMERASDDWGTSARSAWFRMVLVPIKDLENRVEKVFAIMFETTQQRQMDAALELVSRRDGLEILAGGVAHDYNSLLTAIVMSAGMVEQYLDEPDTVVELSQEILLAGRQADFLTRKLLAHASGDRHSVASSDVVCLAQETVRMLESTMGERHAITMASPASALSSLVNEGQFKQVLMNLITNARDALPDEGGEINVTANQVELDGDAMEQISFADLAQPGLWNYVEVRDTGAGMSPDTIERMFEPFFTTKKSGHGLGLAAVTGIIRGYGGGIQVESELGVGTRIGLYLRPTEAAGVAEAIQAPSVIPPLNRVIIADDSSFVRASLRQVFLRLGVEVVEATNGAEALARSREHKPDLVVMDLMMPVMNGLDTIGAIRVEDPCLPVILMSAHAEAGERVAREDAATSFIAKPFELAGLLSVVAAALST
jgi:signal transduction histidine kinase